MRPEILAPCGSPEVLEAALRAGCDAVYLGGESFSARQNAKNFTREELEEAVRLCHIRGVKVYQAINTVLTDDELEACKEAVKTACELGIDGLITQDLALVEIVRGCCPGMPIHASTQMTLHTKEGMLFAKELGFSRAVAARELPEGILKELCSLPIEIEVFVHGALCMSVSGQCYMSALIGSRSANRGLCAQACRLPACAVRGRKNEYALSLKDMSLIPRLDRLAEMGAASLKIEGRMKRPEYTAAAVKAAEDKLSGKEPDMQTLKNVFSRSGFTDGYFAGRTGREMFGTRTKEDALAAAAELPKLHALYRTEEKRTGVFFRLKIKQDEPIELSAKDREGNEVTAFGEAPRSAIKKPSEKEELRERLGKLGSTIYELEGFECQLGEGLNVPASALNELRRDVCGKLDQARFERYTKKPAFEDKALAFASPEKARKQSLRVGITKAEQLKLIPPDKTELVYASFSEAEKLLSAGFDKDKICAVMPRFTFDENAQEKVLEGLCALGLRHIECTNYAHINMGKRLGLELHGGFGLNAANTLALRQLKKLGLADCIVSFELTARQINSLGAELPFGAVAYGRLPMMLTVNCPVRQSIGCKNCKGELFDRTGRCFPMKCSREQGYVEILNSDTLCISDIQREFETPRFFRIDFFEEKEKQAAEIFEAFLEGRTPQTDSRLTKGLYRRGVK